jgi:hypothetical protein
MDYAIKLLQDEIKDLNHKIDGVIDNKYDISQRGDAPAGASWNVSVKDEVARLDKIHNEYEDAIEQCDVALGWLIANA